MRLYAISVTSAAVLAASVCGGCAADDANREPASYAELQEQELSAERQEFIEQTRKDLDEVSNEIGRLSVKLEHEAKFVDEEERASWSQELFDLEQERNRLEGELARAKTADEAEWKEMRGGFGVAMDSLQAGVQKLSNDVSDMVTSDEDDSKDSMQAGLCPLEVPGVAARLEAENGRTVAVVLTTKQRDQVANLQAKARDIAESEKYPNHESNDEDPNADIEEQTAGRNATAANRTDEAANTSEADSMPVSITAKDIEGGTKLEFVPEQQQLSQLRSRLQKDVERLDGGQCRSPGALTMRAAEK